MKSVFYKIELALISVTLLIACSKKSQDLTDNNSVNLKAASSVDPRSVQAGPMPIDTMQLDSLRHLGL